MLLIISHIRRIQVLKVQIMINWIFKQYLCILCFKRILP